MAMTDDELRDLLGQILENQRELQASQLKAEQDRQELRDQIRESTANINRLERIVLRHEGYHIISESERLDLQGQMLELQRRVARLEQRDKDGANGSS